MDREREALANTGNASAALVRARELHTVAQQRAEADPGNVGFQRDLSVSLGRLGRLHQQADELGAARHHLSQAHAIIERLRTTDPTNASYQQDLAYYEARLNELTVSPNEPG